MASNYTAEPDSPLPQRNTQSDFNEQVRWEDLESYTGSSDNVTVHDGSRSRSQGMIVEHESIQTAVRTHSYDGEDVQW